MRNGETTPPLSTLGGDENRVVALGVRGGGATVVTVARFGRAVETAAAESRVERLPRLPADILLLLPDSEIKTEEDRALDIAGGIRSLERDDVSFKTATVVLV